MPVDWDYQAEKVAGGGRRDFLQRRAVYDAVHVSGKLQVDTNVQTHNSANVLSRAGLYTICAPRSLHMITLSSYTTDIVTASVSISMRRYAKYSLLEYGKELLTN